MTKAEIIEAINSTIVANGQKGITAESLKLILTEIVNAAGEGGSGDGALRVIVPELQLLGPVIVESGEFSPTSYAAAKEAMSAEMPDLDWSEYDAAVTAAFEHNASVVQQLMARAKAGQGISVVLDPTPLFIPSINLQMAMAPDVAAVYDEMVTIDIQSASYSMAYIKSTAEGEAMTGISEILQCFIAPVGTIKPESIETLNYPSTMLIELQLDGSLIFSTNNVGTDTESGTESGS